MTIHTRRRGTGAAGSPTTSSPEVCPECGRPLPGRTPSRPHIRFVKHLVGCGLAASSRPLLRPVRFSRSRD